MSFTTEQLDAVTRIVVHDKCPDGLASAIILLDAFCGRLTSKDVIFLEHDTEFYDKHTSEPGALFCDISPPPKRAKEFIATATLVLDHHEPEKVAPYGACGVHTPERGVSGAMLAFREVWMPLKGERSTAFDLLAQCKRIETFATLAGIRDTWVTESPMWRQACAQAAALMFWPRGAWLDDVISKGAHRANSERLDLGETLLQKVESDALVHLGEQDSFISSRGRCVVVLPTKMTSEPAEMLASAFALDPRPANAPDAVVGFRYFVDHGTRKIELSCRSVSDLLVRPFCQHFDGGGHPRAAGVTLRVNARENPYEIIERLWNEWEKTLP